MTGAFNRAGEGALVLRAIACDSSSDNFSLLGQKLTEAFDFLVIKGGHFLGAESTSLLPEESASRSSLVIPGVSSSRVGAFGGHGLERNLLVG